MFENTSGKMDAFYFSFLLPNKNMTKTVKQIIAVMVTPVLILFLLSNPQTSGGL
jgi:hypothetical protein